MKDLEQRIYDNVPKGWRIATEDAITGDEVMELFAEIRSLRERLDMVNRELSHAYAVS